MSGIEVEAIEPAAGDFQGVVVGEVLAVERHPDAEMFQVIGRFGDDAAMIGGVSQADHLTALCVLHR